jgi:hypothetical protein
VTRDPGLQPERVALSWSRTALAYFGICALFVHSADDAAGSDVALILLIALAAVVVTASAVWRRRVVTSGSRTAAAPSVVLVQGIAVGITMTGVGALLLAL